MKSKIWNYIIYELLEYARLKEEIFIIEREEREDKEYKESITCHCNQCEGKI